ncbi:MAG TPA: MBL fold metallo-hydrolase, partial [Vicinamibacterales bacterium]|nr:MBL fold metallo-hydrolase [Vicinamibacterales bacterium]
MATFSVFPVAQERQQPPAARQLEILSVQGNVSVITGAGANIVVQVGDLGPVVVDTGLAQNTDDVLAAIRKLSNRPVRYIINTHMHADHTGGNERVAAAGQP